LFHPELKLAPAIGVGIRAALVDKDKSPRWDPPTLAEVTDERVDEYFASLGERELQLSAQD
jgi:enoyl-CoA hydratase